MSTEHVERLRELVAADEQLQAELLRETDPTAFVARVTRLAAEHDLVVVEGMVWVEIERGRQAWLATCSP